MKYKISISYVGVYVYIQNISYPVDFLVEVEFNQSIY